MRLIHGILISIIGAAPCAANPLISATEMLSALLSGAQICTTRQASLEGVPDPATIVLYTVTPSVSQAARAPEGETRIAVLSNDSGSFRSQTDMALGPGIGAIVECSLELFTARGEQRRPIIVVKGERYSGMGYNNFTEVLAWKPSVLKLVASYLKTDTRNDWVFDSRLYNLKVEPTPRGEMAIILRCSSGSNLTNLGERLPIVYVIRDDKVEFASHEFPEFYDPYLQGPGALGPEAEGANYWDSFHNPVRALIYQRRYREAQARIKTRIKRADRLGERGLELKKSVHQAWAELLIAQGKYSEGEEQFLRAAMATNLGEHFRRYAMMEQIRLGERDQERIKMFSTRPEEKEKWRRALWRSFKPPPANDQDRALALIMTGEHYARIADHWRASGAYRRALSPIEAEAEREIRTWHLKKTTTPPPVPLDQIPQYKRQKTAWLMERIEHLSRLLAP